MLAKSLITLCCGLAMVSCVNRPRVPDFAAFTRDLRVMIEDRATTDGNLQEAISRLGKVSESPLFWTMIINDPSYSPTHRRRCVRALLERHRVGNVGELREMLNRPAWLLDEHITTVEVLGGLVPVDVNLDDTVFQVRLFPLTKTDYSAAAYIRVHGKMSRAEFSRIVRGEPVPASAGGELIQQIGFSGIDYSK